MNNDEPKIKRAIESVLDLRSGQEVHAYKFFQKPISEIFKVRYELESAIRENEPWLVCYYCKEPIKIRGKADLKRILHFAHRRDSPDCHIKTNNEFSKEQIQRIKYNGAKESIRHIELKQFIAASLESNHDKCLGVENVEIEAITKHESIPHTWKRPDVKTLYNQNTLVFELQLNTTFLSVINSRQEFYKQNKIFIIWVFSSFETNEEKRLFTQSDIFFSNNHNGFELNDEAIEKSKAEGDLVLKCHYQLPFIDLGKIDSLWRCEFVKLSDLVFNDETFNVFYFDYYAEYKVLEAKLQIDQSVLLGSIRHGLERSIINIFQNGYVASKNEMTEVKRLYKEYVSPNSVIEERSVGYRVIVTIICMKMSNPKFAEIFGSPVDRVDKIILDILSLKLNKIIGYAFSKQVQISHRVVDSRPEYIELYLRGINQYQPSFFNIQDKSGKLWQKISKMKKPTQEGKYNDLLKVVFPELFDDKISQ